jgi:hypothetical protein
MQNMKRFFRDGPKVLGKPEIIVAMGILVFGYLMLLYGITSGNDKSVNGYSFLLWCGLAICTTFFVSNKEEIDEVLPYFTIIMGAFQMILAISSISMGITKPLEIWEIIAIIIAIMAIIVWLKTREKGGFLPLLMVIVADCFASIPQFMQLYHMDSSQIGVEFLIGFGLFGLIATLVVIGIKKKNIPSLVYPLFEVIVNVGMMSFATYKLYG